MKKKLSGIIAMVLCFGMFTATAFASAEGYSTYYNISTSVWGRSHDASGTPVATITTSNMSGNSDDSLWVEMDKKYWYGWAAPGSGNSSTTVSSTKGSKFTLDGKGKGTYRLGFMKYSYVVNGKSADSKKWYSDLYIQWSN